MSEQHLPQTHLLEQNDTEQLSLIDRARSVAHTAIESVRGRGREFAAVACGAIALGGGIAEAGTYSSAQEAAKKARLAETRSNDTLDRYDLIKPDNLSDPDLYRNPSTAAMCMSSLTEGLYPGAKQKGIIVKDNQIAKRGSNTIKVKFEMADMQVWDSIEGFNSSCAWYLGEQSVQTQLVKIGKNGKQHIIKQAVTDQRTGKRKQVSSFEDQLELPGYSGKENAWPKPEGKKRIFKTPKTIKKGDRYAVKYKIKAKATDEILQHGHISNRQKQMLKPLRATKTKHVKIK